MAAAPPAEPPPPAEPTPAERALAEARALDAGLSRRQRRDIQDSLQQLGHYRMTIDGLFGNGTRSAIRAFQRSLGDDPTGYLTAAQRQRLASVAPPRPAAVTPVVAAPPRRLTVRNLGGTAVVALYASPTTSGSWERNRLSGNVLLPGHSLVIPLPGYGAACDFDVRMVDEYNSIREVWGLDICRQANVDFF